MTSIALDSPVESAKRHSTERTPSSVVADALEESRVERKQTGAGIRSDEENSEGEGNETTVEASEEDNNNLNPRLGQESTTEDTSTEAFVESPRASTREPVITNDTSRPATIPTSPFAESAETTEITQEPNTPVTPMRPRVPDIIRESMASVALSESSLDSDHLSAEQVDECLTTPKARSKHNRKPSSLEILQNSWQAKRQSTLFDNVKDTDRVSILSSNTELPSPDTDKEATRASVVYGTAEAIRVRSKSNSKSVSLVQTSPGSTQGTKSTASSVATPRRTSVSSEGSREVDWSQLDRNEEQEKEDKEIPEGAEDESTAFLLARLEQENAMLTSDPKSAANKHVGRARSQSRPPSMHALKKLVKDRDQQSVRYSMTADLGLPTELPPMTELDFWAALVQDYPSTASRLPTLTAAKVRAGVPEPLRGVVWASMSGARDRRLEEAYDNLLGEKSPYEGIINKDVGRSFPGVELFRDAEGEGQKMLGRVLKCFSLHDKDIGYCQGLGFLVGPLLMNMGEREAFCVLVR